MKRSIFLLLAVIVLISSTSSFAFANDHTPEGVSNATGYGYLAAAIAAGLGTVGAGIAVGITGSAAIGSISERPEMFGKALVFVGLAEGIAIYGLIIAIMILGKL